MMLWLKAFHIVAMVAWFAGLFYLPRLFVYHTEISPADKTHYQRFCTMERRLFRGIMTPSAIITLLLGIELARKMHWSLGHPPLWLAIKLGLVVLLILFHSYCGIAVKQFAREHNTHSRNFYRLFNEIPALILIAVVILVVIKPT